MNINRLNEFIVLATHLNYSKAANQLFLTQPALSRHIHDLEQTVGAKLFIRDTHNVHLTPAGKLFYTEACEVVAKYEHALEVVRESVKSSTGEVRLGFLSAATKPFLSDFCNYFKEAHPEIKLSLCAGDLDPLMNLLNDGDLDCIFASNLNSNPINNVISDTLITCKTGIFINDDHPLADHESVTFADLDNIPLVSFGRKSSPITYEFNAGLFKKRGVTYNVVQEVPNVETGMFYVDLGVGAMLLPDHFTAVAPDKTFVPIEDDIATVDINLTWKKENTNMALPIFHKEFTEFLRELK